MNKRLLFAGINPSTEAGANKIEGVRATVRTLNQEARKTGTGEKFRVILTPRKTRKNPNAWKYDNRFMRGKRMRLEDYVKVDVYVTRRAG